MIEERFEACILGGAIGDAWGSSFENEDPKSDFKTFYLGTHKPNPRHWAITDDTQLTLATCEVLGEHPFNPETLIKTFTALYKQNKITSIGASTLKALLDFDAGMHWTQTGRKGEFAAGNGTAMRIAPFAFFSSITRDDIYDACRITHQNDEAYVGALAIYLSIRSILNDQWDGTNDLIEIIIPQLPDTRVKDRLIEISSLKKSTIHEVAKLGNNGYVVNAVPFAIFSATKVLELGMADMLTAIINTGGDTDSNASMAGQISGALIGIGGIPPALLGKLKTLHEYKWIKDTIDKTKRKLN